MNRFFIRVLIAGVVCCGLFVTAAIGRSASDDASQAALQADHALLSALGKTDKAEADRLLDSDFVWTNGDGQTLKKAEVLGGLAAYANDNEGDENVQSHF